MCGIAGGFVAEAALGPAIRALAHRGPDARGSAQVGPAALGHTRLAILDLNPRSNQPFIYGQTTISFNGEIWNWRELRHEMEALGDRFSTECDTEVLAAALDRWGSNALPKINGMFAVAWARNGGEEISVARDRFGEIPAHWSRQRPFRFASERKALIALGAHPDSIGDVPPGATVTASPSGGFRVLPYYDAPAAAAPWSLATAAPRLRDLLMEGARDRAISDVPVCCLLSGGIDSSAILCALRPHAPGIVAYTAALAGSTASRDLRCAREVADALDVRLVEVPVPSPTAEDLARTVAAIEMPFKAQVEIGWPCLRLAERMRADGFKVTFSGEGSDELWASYGFAYHGLKSSGWHRYRKDLFMTQARKNFPRCNKAFMAHGVECRLPFLHPSVVEFALSLPRAAVESPGVPKAVMREAFRGLLPDSVIDRPKVAFQDGMGIKAAIARTLPDPARYYRAEYVRTYGNGS